VLAVPQLGKPESLYGLVGKYSIETSVDPTSVDVGQPIELTIKVGGVNYLKPVRWPKLEDVDELANNFRISSEREDGVVAGAVKVFKRTIRAENDSVVRIPPIPLAYFDVDKGEYVITESAAIALEVRPSKVFTFADAELMGGSTASREVEAVKKGISANYEDIKLVSEAFSPVAGLVQGGFAAVWAIPLAGFFVSAIVKVLTYRDAKSVARKKRRQALRKAVGRLKYARGLGKADFEKSGRGAVAAAMREYVGDRFGKTAGSLTGMDCERVVLEETGDGEMANRYREIMEGFEASSYSGGARGGDVEDVDGIIELLKAIEKKVYP
ncbi:MAG: protein BatD, partial [Planctomycetes bacterium]|nr:protein BatD [Planctomycetota bacterium]